MISNRTDVRAIVGADGVDWETADNGGAVGAVSAGVARELILRSHELAVLRRAGLDMGRDRVTLGGDHRGLHAGADDLHGALGVVREQRAVQLHADIELAAEAAARGGLDAADVVLGNAKHGGDLVAVIVGVLRGSVHGRLSAAVFQKCSSASREI